jgi:transposase InsO family protein
MRNYGVEQVRGAVRNPNAQARVERFHRTLGDAVAKWRTERPEAELWQLIAEVTYAFNITPNRTTGVPPYLAMFASPPSSATNATAIFDAEARALPAAIGVLPRAALKASILVFVRRRRRRTQLKSWPSQAHMRGCTRTRCSMQ